MMLLAAGELFYQGVQRWDFGLGNPNKAALILAFLALLAVAAAFRAKNRWCSIACAIAGIASCYGLVHSFSRGGFVALLAGLAILLAGFRKQLRTRRTIALALIAVTLIAASVLTGFASRLVSSSPGADGSVGNRLAIWKTVPRMMVDAPGGWGFGNSGATFMGWYQPLERNERYLSLVNSHLTWLTESGWLGRWALVAGWLFVPGPCTMRFRAKGDPVPLSVWVCFWTAAAFSSVAEDWFAWVVPVAAAIPAGATFLSATKRSRLALLAASAMGACGIVLAFAIAGYLLPPAEPPVHRSYDGRQIVLGGCAPTDWIVFDSATMGGETYGRALRRFVRATRPSTNSYGVAYGISAVPRNARRLAICGAAANEGPALLARFPEVTEVRVLSPRKPRAWLAPNAGGKARILVICGELSPSCPPEDIDGLRTIPGASDYLPEWPRLAFGN